MVLIAVTIVTGFVLVVHRVCFAIERTDKIIHIEKEKLKFDHQLLLKGETE
jgi:hypothetical protein